MSTDLQSTEGVSVGHDDIVSVLGLEKELERLKSKIDAWIDASNEEMHACLKWQFSGKPKYFRPVTVFSCFKALHGEAIGEDERTSALIIELVHNMTLIVDDILDNSPFAAASRPCIVSSGCFPP